MPFISTEQMRLDSEDLARLQASAMNAKIENQRLRKEVDRLKKALLCPYCLGSGRTLVLRSGAEDYAECPSCEAAQIRREAQ